MIMEGGRVQSHAAVRAGPLARQPGAFSAHALPHPSPPSLWTSAASAAGRLHRPAVRPLLDRPTPGAGRIGTRAVGQPADLDLAGKDAAVPTAAIGQRLHTQRRIG